MYVERLLVTWYNKKVILFFNILGSHATSFLYLRPLWGREPRVDTLCSNFSKS
jgi:hypothetical protein